MNINHALVSAFERSKERKRPGTTARVFTMLLMTVFFVALIAGLTFGVMMYRSVYETQLHNDDVHLQAGLVANTIHASDALEAVEQGQGPEGQSLVLVERLESGTYETRIYLYKGRLVQEYAVPGRAYNPTTATPLFNTRKFEFFYDGDLLTIMTDRGTCAVALRSPQGGA